MTQDQRGGVAEIVVLGGGVGGTLAANLLARRLGGKGRVRLVDATGRHAYQPGWLHLALDAADSRWLSKDLRRLLDDDVDLLVDRAASIAPAGKTVYLEREGAIDYDYLVVATGARLDRDAVPGLAAGTHDFYSLDGAERLREALRTFDGGRLVIGVCSLPYKCPPAPLEFAFLAEWELRKRGLRNRTTIKYVTPVDGALDSEAASEVIEPILTKRGIELQSGFAIESVDPAEAVISAADGTTVGYDLAVLVPPHRGTRVVVDSGLGDEDGWLPTDPATLQARGLADVFALGDCTDLSVSKAGSTAHFEAPVIVEQIAARVESREPDPVKARYHGKVRCFLEVGGGRATMIGYDYQGGTARPRRPSRAVFAAKWLFDRSYWSIVPKGRF